MKSLKFIFLSLILTAFISCSEESGVISNLDEATAVETRSECEGCTVRLVQNGCEIKYKVSEECGEIASVTWTYPGGQTSNYNGGVTSSTSGGVFTVLIIFNNGCEATASIEVEEGCETRCEGCTAEIIEDNCVLTVNIGACQEGFTYNWSIPVSGGRIYSDDHSVEIGSAGTYCVTITDALGCEVRDCIDVEECECEPEFELRAVDPQINFNCNEGSGLVFVRPAVNFRYSCNDCCSDLDEDERALSFVITRTAFNLTKNIELVNKVNNYDSSRCSSTRRYGISGSFVGCNDIDVGDVLEFNWTVTVGGSVGCNYVGETDLSGSLNYTVTSDDIESCCDM